MSDELEAIFDKYFKVPDGQGGFWYPIGLDVRDKIIADIRSSLSAERDAAIAGAYEAAAKVCDEWAQSTKEGFFDQSLAVSQRAEEIRALTPADALAHAEADGREGCLYESHGELLDLKTGLPIHGEFTLREREIAKARLEEAKWWEHTVGLVMHEHKEGFDTECIYCQRIATLEGKVS